MAHTKLLIVEDDPQIRQIYEFKLSNSGYEVLSADNGVDGLTLAESFAPSLLLLDLQLPQLNGDQLLTKLRAKAWGANMQVIILTNSGKHEAPRGLQFLGVDRFVVKAHHTPAQVVEIVREVLARH